MKIIALIPARSGSKRLNKKNSKNLLGRPLINWTINTAKQVKEISDIFVSTDDKTIIKICKKHNIKVPWKRPKHLCGEKVSSENVALHFLNWYEKKISKIDGLLLLQPTSPFRKKSSIEKAIKLFNKNRNKAIVSFSPFNKFNKNKKELNLIDLVKLNGSIFLTSPKNIRKYKSFFKPQILPLILNSFEESIDIDTHEDWNFAKRMKV